MAKAKTASTTGTRTGKGSAVAKGGAAPAPALNTVAWQNRVVDRSLGKATQRSLERGATLIRAAATLLETKNDDGFTVQEVADEAGQSLRSFYQHFGSKDDLLLAVLEEALQTYAHFIGEIVARYDSPAERLAAGIYHAVAMPERSASGVNVGLSRLHLKLAVVDAAKVAAAQEPISMLFRRLVGDALDAGAINPCDPDSSAYIIVAMNHTYLTNVTLGNEFGLPVPTVEEHTRFCLEGLGAKVEPGWEKRLAADAAATSPVRSLLRHQVIDQSLIAPVDSERRR